MAREYSIGFAPSWVASLRPSEPQGSDLLIAERQKSQIDIDRLACLLYTEQGVEMQRRILDVLQHDPVFDKGGNYFDSRIERFKTSVARAKRLHQLHQMHNWSEDELKWAIELIGEPTAFSLHWKGFLPTLREQGTPEQHELFLRKAESMEIIGCYAQTELGHGSNARKLETTATWNPDDRTFTLHSPHLTAAKWWVGTMGLCANHAMVMARLILNGEDYGPHPFLCQIRDLITHTPLDGVYVGDIGPKLGYNTVDNGFLFLNHVKIPHINMLAKFSRVEYESNVYVAPESPAMVYGTLTMLRAALVSESARNLARGTTIAVRYCAVRRQCSDPDSEDKNTELQVLDYSMVQFRLFPLVAESFALNFTGQAMIEFYHSARTALAVGQSNNGCGSSGQRANALFSELHATSCGLKALATSAAAEGLEVCRRACGGHGYSSFAGIGAVYMDYLPSQTYEGDNYVLTQQTANYLLKIALSILKGDAPSNITAKNLAAYTEKKHTPVHFDLDRDKDILAAFGWRAAYLTFDLLRRRDNDQKPKNDLLVDYSRLSSAHSQFLVLTSFHDKLKGPDTLSKIDPESLAVLWKLFRLYALTRVISASHEFYVSSALQVAEVVRADQETMLRLLKEIRPHAVRLVDVWKLPDWMLDSSLGRYDGKVYEDLFHRASQLNPLNRFAMDPRPGGGVLIRGGGADAKSRL
ncbi:acyl-CoA oxidase [Cladophialophora psammophila CBS 110553]|uniref:Acyl-coenzyme A oxidase n=1 Tax=Cladophialophora psammophila CBS 110553 TaxID=1182543 RepID=W9W0F0_9EURO|nr:acyl-CoA oxidase [Cladophialophora psammophila CBS 110553]EXJ61408.1 acyl-CoA oxidase [Cladophialophora psammophila CBS 110553]